MRFYLIQLTNAAGKVLLPLSLQGIPIGSLLSNGQANPAALNVEFDVPVTVAHTPQGQVMVRIWGLGIEAMGSAFNLNSTATNPIFITVWGGMSKGLPLANPGQQGMLFQGQVNQAFGNWIGLDQTIDLICSASVGTYAAPRNIVLNWKSGTTMASAISATLAAAFPGVALKVNINPNLVLNHDQVGYHFTLTEFAEVVKEFSQKIIGGSYPGVDIVYTGGTMTVTDGTGPTGSISIINFQDLLGQPTWINPGTISVKVVLCGDLNPNDLILLPPSLVTTTQQSMSQYNPKTSFTGIYKINTMRHYGNFRQPDAASWNTTLECIPQLAT